MKHRRVRKLLTQTELKRLTTPRVLAYKNRLMNVPEGPNWEEDNVERLNKADPKWKQAYADVKAVLASREHVP
jgi:hypothetical protein